MESKLAFKVLSTANPQVGFGEVVLPDNWFFISIIFYCTDSAASGACYFATFQKDCVPNNSDWEYRIGAHSANNNTISYGSYIAFKLSKYKFYLSAYRMNSIDFSSSIHTYILYTV